jgi:hypothetical protein
MAENDSPESLSKKWFLLAALGAVVYFSVVFGYVILGNDRLIEQPQTSGDNHHD